MVIITAQEVLMAYTYWTIFIPTFSMLKFRFDNKNQLITEIDNVLRDTSVNYERGLEFPKPGKWVLVDVVLNLIIDRKFIEDFLVFGGAYVVLPEEACAMSMKKLVTDFEVGKMVSDTKAAYERAGYQMPSTTNQFVRLQFPSHAMPFGVPLDRVKDESEPWESVRKTTVSPTKFQEVITRFIKLQQFQPQLCPSMSRLANDPMAACPSEKDWVLIDPSASPRKPVTLDRSSSIDVLKKDYPYLVLSRSGASVFAPTNPKGAS